jgi:hypothetical protein
LGGKLTTTASEKILRKLNVWRMCRLAGSRKQATGGGIATGGTNARGTDAVAIGTATAATATTVTTTISVAGAIAKSNELQAIAQARMEKRHWDLDHTLKAGSRRGVIDGLWA